MTSEIQKDEAVREIRDIHRIMDESSRRSRSPWPWAALAFMAFAIVVIVFVPLMAPIFGAGLLAGGIVAYRRTRDTFSKAVSAVSIALGAGMILVFILVILFLTPVSVTTEGGGVVESLTHLAPGGQ